MHSLIGEGIDNSGAIIWDEYHTGGVRRGLVCQTLAMFAPHPRP